MLSPLPVTAASAERASQYKQVLQRIHHLITPRTDWVAAMATVTCELHQAFEYYHWTGFYRAVSPELLLIGPYQGTHGCLEIPFSRGICGAAARTRTTQLIPDVHQVPDHIACSSSTQSEIVVPILTPEGRVLAVLDVDSDFPAAFTTTDQTFLEQLCHALGQRFGSTSCP